MPVPRVADGEPSTSRHPQDSITTTPTDSRLEGTFSGHGPADTAHPMDRKSHPGNAPDPPEKVPAAMASEGTQRERAQNRIQHAPGAGQPGVVPAAPLTDGTFGFGDGLYLFFFFLNFPSSNLQGHQTCKVTILRAWQLVGAEFGASMPLHTNTSSETARLVGFGWAGPDLHPGPSLGVGERLNRPPDPQLQGPCRRSRQLAGRCRGRADCVG
jgi:hypothetical protein